MKRPAPWSMHRVLAVLAPPLGLAGCILAEEVCGTGFVERGGRCVAVAVDGSAGEDVETQWPDAGPDAPDLPPLVPPDAAAANPWASYFAVLVVDRTPDDVLPSSSSTPGCDLDGVVLRGEGLNAAAVKLLASLTLDPYGQSIGREEGAALGMPEMTGELGTFVSLGGGGGYQLLQLELARPIAPGDELTVVEYEEPRDRGDVCAIWLCREAVVDLAYCRYVGEGRGGRFVLE